jgi:hypothetical protein
MTISMTETSKLGEVNQRTRLCGRTSKVRTSWGGQIADAPVRHEHALGAPRRSRRVNDISEIVRTDLDGRRPFGLRGDGGAMLVEEDDARVRFGQGLSRAALGDEHANARVLQHEGEARARIGRVERDVRAAGLQHADDGDQKIERALGANAHPRTRPDAERT